MYTLHIIHHVLHIQRKLMQLVSQNQAMEQLQANYTTYLLYLSNYNDTVKEALLLAVYKSLQLPRYFNHYLIIFLLVLDGT